MRQLVSLRSQVSQAYAAYEADPFIVCHQIRHIFYTPLAMRLKQDVDGLQCFLATYNVAIQEQAAHRERQAEAASKFFFPRDLPTWVVQKGSANSASTLSSLFFDTYPEVSAGTISEASLDSLSEQMATISGMLRESETLASTFLCDLG